MLGVDVITGDEVTYEIPLETLIERDPQVIILGVNAFYTPTAASIAKRTGWTALTAVKNGDIRSVTDTEITRSGSATGHGHAQPRPGDVPRPRRSVAGALTATDGGPHDPDAASRRSASPVGSAAARRRSRAIGLVVLGVAAGRRGDRRVDPDRAGATPSAVIVHRLLGLDVGAALDRGDRDDRLGAPSAAGPDGRRRRAPVWPSPARRSRASSATRSPTRTCWARRRAPRSAPRSGDPAAGRPDRLPVRHGQRLGVRRRPRRGVARLPPRWRWRRRAG